MSGAVSRPLVSSGWTRAYVGKPWEAGQYGPTSFDCWGLVHCVYLSQLGIDLPKYPGLDALGKAGVRHAMADPDTVAKWQPLAQPEDLCLVAMGQRVVDHVGVYVAGTPGSVLHAGSTVGVVLQPLSYVRSRFSKVLFYVLR